MYESFLIKDIKKFFTMKYMKLGTKPDTFYTEEAVRSVLSDVPADLIIHVNNTKYQLHKVLVLFIDAKLSLLPLLNHFLYSSQC
jgi:hypothetical protein